MKIGKFEFNLNKETALSLGVAVGGVVLAALKSQDEKNKKAAEEEKLIAKVIDRLNSSKED